MRLSKKIELPKDVFVMHHIMSLHDKELHVVGGAVRDSLLGIKPKDWDLVTDAKPSEVKEIFSESEFVNNVLDVGESFGVIILVTDSGEYEVATMRADVGKGRRPDSVSFKSTMKEDVMRRGLTMNALFYDIGSGEVVDLVGGVEDIKNGVVRAVGKASERFDEDRLRILRAIRFAGRFGSDLNKEIDEFLIKDNSLQGVSGERIRDEFIKGIKSAKSTKHFLGMIDKYNLFHTIFGGLEPINKEFVESNDELLVISKLLSEVPHKIIGKKLNSIKYSSDEVRKITFLVRFLQSFSKDTFYDLKKIHSISKLDDGLFKEFSEVMSINHQLVKNFIEFNFTVDGGDVMDEFKLKAGPELGKKIKWLETSKFFSV